MKITRFDHISIAVRNLDEAITTFSRLFNLKARDRRKVKHIGIENAFIPLGDAAIELIKPLDDPDSPDDVRRTLDRRGEGVNEPLLDRGELGRSYLPFERLQCEGRRRRGCKWEQDRLRASQRCPRGPSRAADR